MPIKKAMLALGLVCVVAPALASAAFMARQAGYSPGQGPDGGLAALIASLQELIDRENKGVEFVEDGSEPGLIRIPFRRDGRGMVNLSNVVWTFDPKAVEEAFPDDSTTSGMMPGAGGPIGAPEDEVAAPGGAGGDGSMASNGGAVRAGGIGGGSSAGGGTGAGGGSGSEATDLALLVESDEEPLGNGLPGDGTLSVMPLPASVWMLLASMVGLVVIGYQRRRRPF